MEYNTQKIRLRFFQGIVYQAEGVEKHLMLDGKICKIREKVVVPLHPLFGVTAVVWVEVLPGHLRAQRQLRQYYRRTLRQAYGASRETVYRGQ